jgi:ligand-binding sensor domain-containing protein/two-component sensor histidine kinase
MRRCGLQQKTKVRHALWLTGLFLGAWISVRAERLPLRAYTTSDGLANNTVNKIIRDSRGFLWLCTAEGLSRFDGYTFANYGTEQGLPDANVNDLLETREGDYWLATNGGLVHFNPKGAPTTRPVNANEGTDEPSMFTIIRPTDEDRHARSVSVLVEGRDGTIWCGTLKGLYRLDTNGGRFALVPVDLGMPGEFDEQRFVNDLVEDRLGSLWAATPSGLYRRFADGSTARYTSSDGLPGNFLQDLLLDHDGRLWVGSRDAGLFQLNTDETPAKPSIAFALVPKGLQMSEWINQLFETSDHKLWAASAGGLIEIIPSGDTEGRLYHPYSQQNGLSANNVSALNEDTDGNLWLGSGSGTGVMKLVRSGFITYGEQDAVNSVFAIFGDRTGGVCFRGYVLGDKQASVFDGGKLDLLNFSESNIWFDLGYFDGRRLTWFVPDALKGKALGWVGEGVTFQSHNGEWWVGAGTGLYRFPAVDSFAGIRSVRPLSFFGKESVLGGRQIFRVFEDSRERIWISTIASEGNGLAVWEHGTETMREMTSMGNLPSLHEDLARSFGEDYSGDVWIGFNTGLARFRDGAITFFAAQEGLPPGAITDIFTDHDGRLWLASAHSGLIRVDDLANTRPTFTSYMTAQGLSSNVVSAVTGDSYGRIYAGTGRGLDQLDPASGRIRHYTTADGLAGSKITAAYYAPDGQLWVGTTQGLSRFRPEPERLSPPPVLLTGLQVAGAEQHISALGETDLHLPDLPVSSSQLQIDFVGLGFAPGESLQYQYMLEGADNSWGTPTSQRRIIYARLAPGRYRFLVRAVNADGQASNNPAVVTFRVLPPVWFRWWFIILATLSIACGIYALYRYRLARMFEVADMRTRIATDLHDDIGANLTRIAILSEVAKQHYGNGSKDKQHPLEAIADIARASVASMGDIVWAINPERDSLRDLVRRMRQHADEIFTLRDIALEFNAPAGEQNLRLDAGVRRDLLLIFKEAINNAARHADCTLVKIELDASGPWLSLTVADNGRGFDATSASEGHGLVNMHRRAKNLKGILKLETSAGHGTKVTLRFPRARTSVM